MSKFLPASCALALAALVCIPALAQPVAGVAKPHLVMIIAEDEYKTEQTLPPFAKENLRQDFRITILEAEPDNANRIQNLGALKTADVLLVSVRRRPLVPEQMAAIRKYVELGRPVVGIRTASHAFCLRNQEAPAGLADWPTFDPDVLGGHYVNHHGNDIKCLVKVDTRASEHAIMRGIPRDEWPVFGSLYRCLPLADSTRILMHGRAEDKLPLEPVAWTNQPSTGNRVFYTSLGHPHDFTIPAFVQLLRNGIYWAGGLEIPSREVVTLQNPPDKD